MRFLRSSQYVGMHEPPITAVIAEESLVDTAESAHYRLRVPGSLVLSEIFDAPDDTNPFAVTKLAMERFREREAEERMMAISFFWNAAQLARVKDRGLLINNRPAPITAADYHGVLEQLALHPNYRHQTLVVLTSDGRTLELSDGKVVDRSAEEAS